MVRRIMKSQYHDTPDGLCGNEDCGQMSAWYVLSAMGFYSDCPGSLNYSIGSPIFDKVILHLDNGKTFTIKTNNNGDKELYIQSALLNGYNLNKALLLHSEIIRGGELVLEMGKEPNKNWAVQDSASTQEYKTSPMVYLTESSDIFIEKLVIDIKCDDPHTKIYYTLDGTIPNRESKKFELPFFIYESVNLKMRSYKDGCEDGPVVGRELRKQEPISQVSSNLISGLSYSYYEGIYRSVYDFEQDVAIKKGVVSMPTLNVCSRKEWIGLEFGGFIEIPSTGKYTFYMSANDGCQMLIDGEEQFESDGRKSNAFGQKSTLLLSKGFHRINMKFYQCSDNIHLSVEWKGPGFVKQIIPGTVFYHI
ncbi:MAG: glycoside hydrolase family 92 protein, partial [Labilibaculum sp.]|nr:glycoside hydrolase family 92 protein [Labilibaculum sp.]